MPFIKIAALFGQVWRKISPRTHMVGVQFLAEDVNLIRGVLVLRDDPHTKREPRFLGWGVKEPGLNVAMLLGGDNTATWIFLAGLGAYPPKTVVVNHRVQPCCKSLNLSVFTHEHG